MAGRKKGMPVFPGCHHDCQKPAMKEQTQWTIMPVLELRYLDSNKD